MTAKARALKYLSIALLVVPALALYQAGRPLPVAAAWSCPQGGNRICLTSSTTTATAGQSVSFTASADPTLPTPYEIVITGADAIAKCFGTYTCSGTDVRNTATTVEYNAAVQVNNSDGSIYFVGASNNINVSWVAPTITPTPTKTPTPMPTWPPIPTSIPPTTSPVVSAPTSSPSPTPTIASQSPPSLPTYVPPPLCSTCALPTAPPINGPSVTQIYAPGYNMVGGPPHSDFRETQAVLSYDTASGKYVDVTSQSSAVDSTGLKCTGYFAYFPAPTAITLPARGSAGSTETCSLISGWNLIGNPFSSAAILPSGTTGYHWNGSTASYDQVGQIPVGGAVWVYNGGQANSVVLAATSGNSAAPSPTATLVPTQPPPTAAPTSPPPPSPIPAVAPKTTKVLGQSALSHLREPGGAKAMDFGGDNLTLVFTKPGPTLRGLHTGDVLVSGRTRETPDGLLRKVTGVRFSGSRERVITVAASIFDAWSQGAFDVTKDFKYCKSRSNFPFTLDAQHGSGQATGSFTANVQVCFSGHVEFATFWQGAGAFWQGGGRFWSTFNLTATETFDLTAHGEGSFGGHAELKLAPDNDPSQPGKGLYLGDVPIPSTPFVLTPRLELNLTFDPQLQGTFDGHIRQEAPITAVGTCDSELASHCMFSNSWQNNFPVHEATLSGSLSAKLAFEPKLFIDVDKLPGPYVSLSPFLEAHNREFPEGGLYWGGEASVGYEFDGSVFGKKLVDWQFDAHHDFPLIERLIMRFPHSTPTVTPTPPTPLPTSVPTPIPPTSTPTPPTTTPTPTVTPPTVLRCPDESLVAVTGCYRIFTDKTQYTVGDSIKYCYSVPGPSHVQIVDSTPDGNNKVILDVDDDGTGDCQTTTVTPPTGRECLTLRVAYGGSTYSDQACFDVLPAGGGTGTCGKTQGQQCTAIWLDFSGDTQPGVCYSVPHAANVLVTLTDVKANKSVNLASGYDDGSGDCISNWPDAAAQAGIQIYSYYDYRFTLYVYGSNGSVAEQASTDYFPAG